MNKSLRRRVAAVATTATVGGLLLPFLAAGSAFAVAIPAGSTLSASPSVVNANASATSQNVTVNATLTLPSAPGAALASNAIGIYGLTGFNSSTTSTACTFTTSGLVYTATCLFPTLAAAAPGTDNLRVFYDPAATLAGAGVAPTYSPTLLQAPAQLVTSGPLTAVTITASSATTPPSAANGVYGEYTISGTDAQLRPVVSTSYSVTATETGAANADLGLSNSKTTAFPYAAAVTGANGVRRYGNNQNGGATPFLTSADGSNAAVNPAGSVKFYAASRVNGSVALAATAYVGTAATATGAFSTSSLTVNPGLVNDVTAVTVTPTAVNGYAGDTASAVVNFRNAQGNPVANQTPTVSIGGPNSSAAFTPGTTDGNGNVTVSYTATNAGTDTITATVKGSTSTASGAARITNVTYAAATNKATFPVVGTNVFAPLNVKTAVVVFNATAGTTGNPLVGYNATFGATNTTTSGSGTTRLSVSSSGVTDANGNVTATVTDTNPVDGDKASIIATIGNTGGTSSVSPASTVTFQASTVSTNSVRIVPLTNTTTTSTTNRGTAAFQATATDQFNNPISGVNYTWSVSGRNTTNGNGSSFSYTDAGASTNQDAVSVVASLPSNGTINVAGNATATQYWIATPFTATQANIDLGVQPANPTNTTTTPQGAYSSNSSGAIIPGGFVTKTVTAIPTTANPVINKPAAVSKVLVLLTDNNNNRLFGKTVSFSSTGVGGFTDVQGNPLANPTATTSVVLDAAGVAADKNYLGVPNGSTANYATAYVRSTAGGVQNITATVDGVTSNATVTYAGQFVGVTPFRVMDTRTGQGGLAIGGGSTAPVGPLAPNTSYTLGYAAAGLPAGAAAYAFNVTAIKPSGVGNLRVAPGVGLAAPATSLINYQSGNDVANFVIVPNVPGVDALQLYSAAASVNVAIDFVGSYPAAAAASINPTVPSRISDTRNGATPIAVGETRGFQIAGQGGLPATTAKAVALNVTVVNPSSLGNLRIFADGDALPTTSNINYIPGQDKSAFVIVNLPASGKINVYSAGTPVDVAIDAYASYDKVTSNVVTQTPVRILDTRITGNPIAASGVQDLQVAGAAGVPATAQAVLVSVTSIHTVGSLGSGNLGAFPSGGATPIISTLNYVSPTADVANFAIVKLGANGKISIDSMGSPTDVAVDVLGYVPAG